MAISCRNVNFITIKTLIGINFPLGNVGPRIEYEDFEYEDFEEEDFEDFEFEDFEDFEE